MASTPWGDVRQHLILMSVHRSGEQLDDTGMLGEVGTDSVLG